MMFSIPAKPALILWAAACTALAFLVGPGPVVAALANAGVMGYAYNRARLLPRFMVAAAVVGAGVVLLAVEHGSLVRGVLIAIVTGVVAGLGVTVLTMHFWLKGKTSASA